MKLIVLILSTCLNPYPLHYIWWEQRDSNSWFWLEANIYIGLFANFPIIFIRGHLWFTWAHYHHYCFLIENKAMSSSLSRRTLNGENKTQANLIFYISNNRTKSGCVKLDKTSITSKMKDLRGNFTHWSVANFGKLPYGIKSSNKGSQYRVLTLKRWLCVGNVKKHHYCKALINRGSPKWPYYCLSNFRSKNENKRRESK